MALYDTLFAMMDLQVCSTFLPTAEPWLQKDAVQLQQCRTSCLLRKQILDSVRGSKCYLRVGMLLCGGSATLQRPHMALQNKTTITAHYYFLIVKLPSRTLHPAGLAAAGDTSRLPGPQLQGKSARNN
jgi:hypothetical protein